MSRIQKILSLLTPYWLSKHGRRGWLLLIITITLTSLSTYSSVYFAEWNNTFYNALESREENRILHEIFRFAYILAAMSIISVNKNYFLSWLKLDWREWMSKTYTEQWLRDNNFYHINRDDNIDNIDQRISSDIHSFINETTSLFFSFIDSVMTIGSFSFVLWTVSGTLEFEWLEYQFAIKGYLVYAAFIYAIVGFLFARLIGYRFKILNWQREKVEADYRRQLMTITEHDEAIAFANANSKEQKSLNHYFSAIVTNTKELMTLNRRFNLYTLFYGQGMFLPPLFLVLPQFLAGVITIGGFMQIRIAFSQVVGSLSWFTDSYALLMRWFASIDRITEVNGAIHMPIKSQVQYEHSEKNIILNNVVVQNPKHETLLTVNHWVIEKGQTYLFNGMSGSGKTSLIKTIVGLWPFAQGKISKPKNILVISQRDFIPALALRDAITYTESSIHSDDAIRYALAQVNLSQYSNQLDDVKNWQQILSGGERQRLRLVKCFLNQPQWLILDEAFSAIDETTAEEIMTRLQAELPNTAIICIAHNDWIHQYCQHELLWKPYEQT